MMHKSLERNFLNEEEELLASVFELLLVELPTSSAMCTSGTVASLISPDGASHATLLEVALV